MGPTIILDKSAYQSLSRDDIFELDRYFFVVVAPVLLLEVLADLKKPGVDPEKARDVVQQLAKKIQPVEGIVNATYRTLCISNLLGGDIPLDRRAMVAGGHKFRAGDGSVFGFIDVQPENEALMRWSCRQFDQAEEILATRWREACRAIDLDTFKRQIRKGIPKGSRATLSLIRQLVDQVIAMPSAQITMIDALLAEIRTIPEVRRWTLQRWRSRGFSRIEEFAPYAHHCVRVSLIFQQALAHELVGTRATNRIDMEYLYYSPFAHVFCSNDKLHLTLAKGILQKDQSLIRGEELRLALRQVCEARHNARETGEESPAEVEPEEGSLIRKLWMKHFGH